MHVKYIKLSVFGFIMRKLILDLNCLRKLLTIYSSKCVQLSVGLHVQVHK